jgi:hypothetical protein
MLLGQNLRARRDFDETNRKPGGTKRAGRAEDHLTTSYITLAAVTDAFAGGFGAAAAIVMIGGAVLLRWQRNRLQFNLMQTAIERGVTPMQGAPPLWLLSLRQGVMILALGAGLLLAGWFVYQSAAAVAMPAVSTSSTQPAMMGGPGGFRPPPPQMGDDGPPDQFGPPDGPRDGPRGMNGPGNRRFGPPGRGPGGNDGQLPPPPRGNPAIEYWHRAQDQKAVATVAMGSGLVLALLGIVRVLFAFAERRYAGDAKGIA